MAGKKKSGTAKRFGARYGRKIRQRVAEIEKQQKATYKCPYCNYTKVKRVSVGIWLCSKCNSKFASKAYTVAKKLVIKKEE